MGGGGTKFPNVEPLFTRLRIGWWTVRLALCPSAYSPDVGGVEEHVRNLSSALVAEGHQVEIWTPAVVGRTEYALIDGIPVHRLPTPLPGGRPGPIARFLNSYPPARTEWAGQVKRFRPDIINTHCFGPNGVYSMLVAGAAKIPLVISLHGETFMDDRSLFTESAVMRVALRAGLKRASAVTGCSQVVLNDAHTRFGLAPDAGTVVFNGVDLGELRTTRTESGIPGRAPQARRYVVALGRLVKNKGFDLLIKAFVRLADTHPDVDLLIGGSGPVRPSLESLVAKLGLEGRVRLPGRLDRVAVGSAMAGASVFAMPSRIEPFGIVVLEAWRAGIPVVASSRGGAPEFVTDGVDGLLVDPENERELADALTRLLNDRSMACRLAAAGTEKVAGFGWPGVCEKYEAIYRQVIA